MSDDAALSEANEVSGHLISESTLCCDRCGAVIKKGRGAMIVFTRFPDDLGASFALVTGEMGSTLCPGCGFRVDTGGAHVALLSEERGILGLPAGWQKDVCDQILAKLRNDMPEWTWQVFRHEQLFRRAVIEQGMSAAIDLERKYSIADDKLKWISENAARLDPSLFSALWLVAHGIVKTFVRPLAEAHDQLVFLPKEVAPPEAHHVGRQDEAAEHMRERTAELIATLLIHTAERCRAERSIEALHSLKKAVPAFVLHDLRLRDELFARIGQIIESVRRGRPGWILQRYLLEACVATLCATHGQENARRAAWAYWSLYYDMNRRLDGNDESVLLPVDVLKSTLHPPNFWESFHAIFRDVVRDKEAEPSQRQLHLQMLWASASRVFPEELPGQIEHYLYAMSLAEGEAADAAMLLESSVKPVLNMVALRRSLALLCRTKAPSVAQQLIRALAGAEAALSDRDRLVALTTGMEFLKEHQRAAEAMALGRAGQTLMPAYVESGEREPEVIGEFLNELGNALRLLRRLQDAESAYRRALALLDGDLNIAARQVCLRNLAIVLRECHRYGEALPIFRALRDKARSREMPGLITSEALCLYEMGQAAQAFSLMRDHIEYVSRMSFAQPGAVEFGTFYATLLADAGELETAAQLLAQLRAAALARNYVAAEIVSRDVELRRATTDVQRSTLVDAQLSVLERLNGHSIGSVDLGAIGRVVDGLVALGDLDRAEKFLRGLADVTPLTLCPRAWQLYVRIALLAKKRGDIAQCMQNVEYALVCLHIGVAKAVSSGDLHHFTAPDVSLLDQLVVEALDLRSRDGERDGWRWRNAVDAFAAPALTAWLRNVAGISEEPDVDEEARRVSGWLRSSGGAVVQICSANGRITVLTTTLGVGETLLTTQHQLPVSTETARRIVNKLSFKLQRARLDAIVLPLDALDGWSELEDSLMKVFEGLPGDRPLMVVAGPLQETVISVMFGDCFPLFFVPSLRAAVALYEREPTKARRAEGLFGFAAWLNHEVAEPAAALAAVPNALAQIAYRHGLPSHHAAGLDATRDALLHGLTGSYAAWIACHGCSGGGGEAFDLLVAADGRLPPAQLAESDRRWADTHVVRWIDLASLERAPAVVFSSACYSGQVHTNLAGERIGLERALLPAGTSQIVAPLWPVPTVAIQQVVARLIDLWLGDPATPLAVHVMRTRQWCKNTGMSPLAGQALALFGLPSRKDNE